MLNYSVIPDSERRRELQTAKAMSDATERAANFRRIATWNRIIKTIEENAENGYHSCMMNMSWLKEEDLEELRSKGYTVTHNDDGDIIIKWG